VKQPLSKDSSDLIDSEAKNDSDVSCSSMSHWKQKAPDHTRKRRSQYCTSEKPERRKRGPWGMWLVME